MIVEIKGVGCHNKGAEMMMLTILQELNNDNVKFCVSAQVNSCEYDCYSKYGLYPKIWFRYKGIHFGKIANLLPFKLRKIYGLIVDKEIDVILDASGFAYSSQWGTEPTKKMAEDIVYWKKRGKKVIFLPQAFGPFKNGKIKKYMKIIIKHADLLFARDKFSYNELVTIKNDKKIKLYPDFTNLFQGKRPPYWREKLNVCIVPNKRMKDKRKDAENYETLMSGVIEYFQNKNFKPFFLIFGGKEDLELAKRINNILESKIPIIYEENPHYIKGIISASVGVVASRFHAITSALSAGVVAIGMGWSHKYKYIFDDYDFPEGLIDINIGFEDIRSRLNFIVDNKKNLIVKKHLTKKNKILRKKTKEMFEIVKKEIGLL